MEFKVVKTEILEVNINKEDYNNLTNTIRNYCKLAKDNESTVAVARNLYGEIVGQTEIDIIEGYNSITITPVIFTLIDKLYHLLHTNKEIKAIYNKAKVLYN